MKKYYIILSVIGVLFAVGVIGLILNPEYQFKYLFHKAPAPEPTTAGNVFAMIGFGLLVLAIAALIVYYVYTIYARKNKKRK